ncbi:excalibur calcium-binding domain-containing protein [Pseudoalteromonas sp. GB56]
MRFTVLCCLGLLASLYANAQETWRGLVVEPENRCSPYDKSSQYPYPQSVEDRVVASMGGLVYGPYTGRYFESDRQTDIEHIVAASEGHDSGLCAASAKTREQFATDLLNLTLAAPEINRCGAQGKCGLDANEWMPAKNQCWFANRVVQIKTKYGLSVDAAEAQTLETVLANCESTELVYYPRQRSEDSTTSEPILITALDKYDDNRNGRISCAEARAHGITPVSRDHAAYSFMSDRNNDGVVCE